MARVETLSHLTSREKEALFRMKKEVLSAFPSASVTLYGSKARGDFDAESDIDILIEIDEEITRTTRERIILLIYDIELDYDVIISPLLETRAFWNSPDARSMPVHEIIQREGMKV